MGESDHHLIHQPLAVHRAGDRDELHIRGKELTDQAGGVELLNPRMAFAARTRTEVEQVGLGHHCGQSAREVGVELRLHVGLEQVGGLSHRKNQ